MNKYVVMFIITCIIYMLIIEVYKYLRYGPVKYIDGDYESVLDTSTISEMITTDNGSELHIITWYKNSPKYLLICHSEVGNILDTLEISNLFKESTNVVLFDYVNYGKSSNGMLSEKVLKDNVLAVWNHLTQDKDIDPAKITLMGDRLGGSIAIWLCAFLSSHYTIYPRALILINAYSSGKECVTNIIGLNLIKLIARKEYNVYDKVGDISNKVKILLIYNTINKHIYMQGLKLYYKLLETHSRTTLINGSLNDSVVLKKCMLLIK